MARRRKEDANEWRHAAVPRDPHSMPWVTIAPGGRYFMTEDGAPFLVIGHNEAMTWPTLSQLHHEDDVAEVEANIKRFVDRGVTVIRIMLEYCQDDNWYFEDPVGTYQPAAVLFWDDLIGLCEKHGLRLLLLFWDTFFMVRRWDHHPYGKPGSGFDGPGSICTSETAMKVEKVRIRFFIDRWGDSPAIFGYDLLNEIHPYLGGDAGEQHRWVGEMARFVKGYEMERWGKRHLLTVSVFGSTPEEGYDEIVFRHPELDFATTHVYECNSVDNPDNVIGCAQVMQQAVELAYAQTPSARPYTDSESGPIHLFMDLHGQLEDEFEVEYYHNICWAHLASGGAGSGMRWPFRNPHTLTESMHGVQSGMATFVRDCSIDWTAFSPRPLENPGGGGVLVFGCSDLRQALVWLLRDNTGDAGATAPKPYRLDMPDLRSGVYRVEFWETYTGVRTGEVELLVTGSDGGTLDVPPFEKEVAITITRRHAGEQQDD